MKFRMSDWILLLIILTSFFIGLYIYPELPDKIATHWNIQGEPDNYSSKNFAVFGLAAINIAIFFLMIIVPRFDPRRKNYQRHEKVYIITRWSIAIFMVLIYFFTLYSAYSQLKSWPPIDISAVIPFFLGVLFLIIGNYLTRVKSNYFFGIRTPWTLEDTDVWKKTHRMGGRLFVVAGFLSMISPVFSGKIRFFVVISSIVLASFIPFIYSYIIYKNKNR